jgi:DNA-binding transcriptional ArsR family regulator
VTESLRDDDSPRFGLIAGLLGHRSRARMIELLMDGRAHPAGELARAADLSAQSASMHLRKLRENGVVAVQQSGRHRQYRLSGAHIAGAIEALGSLGPHHQARRTDEIHAALSRARTCYDHLAGRLGVRVTGALARRGHLDPCDGTLRLSVSGEEWMKDFGIHVDALRRGRRPLTLTCEDWTERRAHLAGALGAALLDRMLAMQWVARLPNTRALRVTTRGRTGLQSMLGIDA